MSVMETNTVDGMGISKEGNELVMLITDHLDWEYEPEHLLFLQEKINSYIHFVESKQYEGTYPATIFDAYVIEIRFMYDISENCLEFLDMVANKLEPRNIKIVAEFSPMSEAESI